MKNHNQVNVSVHAILRFHERANNFNMQRFIKCLSENNQHVSITDDLVFSELMLKNKLPYDDIIAALTTPAVKAAAMMNNDKSTITVITEKGRIIVKNNCVVSFLDKESKKRHLPNPRAMLDNYKEQRRFRK